MKLLVHSNSPWSKTGYGTQTNQLATRLKAAGHDVAVSCYYGLQGSSLEWDGIMCYPGGYDSVGNDVLPAWANHHLGDLRAGWIITLMDVWTLLSPALSMCNIASWCPVDHSPVPPEVVRFFTRTGAVPIAMSRFGEMEMERAGLNPLYVPHGIPTDEYTPQERVSSREKIGLPEDAFIVGMVAYNQGAAPPRKAFPQAFRAFRDFAKKHDDALLYVHTERLGVSKGINLIDLTKELEIEEKVEFVNQFWYRFGLPNDYMAHAYSAMDVLVNPSYGEGFGLPIVESQACGTPVIVTDFSSMPELCGAGWLVEGEPWWDPHQTAWYAEPSVAGIVDRLETAYTEAASLRTKAREFALAYDADVVFDTYWKPALEDIEKRTTESPLDALRAVGA